MTTSAAHEYAAPVHPSATSPTVRSERVQNSGAVVALFRDDVWPLGALGSGTGVQLRSLNFSDFPEGFKSAAKLAAYLFINEPTPSDYYNKEGSAVALWPSPSTINHFVSAIRAVSRIAVQLPSLSGQTKVRGPRDLDGDRLQTIREIIDADTSLEASSKNSRKSILIRLPYLNPMLPENERWHSPPWERTPWRTPIPRGANQYAPIPQRMMAPLLEWALTVLDAADEIFSAREKGLHILGVSNKASRNHAKARRVLASHLKSGTLLPAHPYEKGAPFAGVFLSGTRNVHKQTLTIERMDERFKNLSLSASPSSTALDVTTTTTIHGHQWIECISYYDVVNHSGIPPLLRVIRAAALITIAYLTGMRPQEVVSLREGCSPEPITTENGKLLHLINGHVFKRPRVGADRQNGIEGSEPATWATIPEGRQAALVAGKANQVFGIVSPHLFPRVKSPDSAYTSDDANDDISFFVRFVNARLVPDGGLSDLAIPLEDDDELISMARFRRTLAWFIRNQPNGNVTLAIQYQHLSTTIGEGYASTAASGFPELLVEEGWDNRKSVIEHLRDIFSEGAGISGPGAARIVSAVRAMPQVVSEKAERQLAKDPRFTIYANPHECSYCAADPESMLCVENPALKKDAAPNLAACRGQVCPNYAATDENAAQLTIEVGQLLATARAANPTRAPSLLQKARELDRSIEQHKKDRRVPILGVSDDRT